MTITEERLDTGPENIDPLNLTGEDLFANIMSTGLAVPVGEINGEHSTFHIELLEKRLANAGYLSRVTIGVTVDPDNPNALIAFFRPRED